jgi:hypothetical protein
MRIPLFPGKLACNGGKRATRSAELWRVFSRLSANSAGPRAAELQGKLQGKNRGQQGNCSGIPAAGGAVARPKLIRLIIRVTGDTIALFGEI